MSDRLAVFNAGRIDQVGDARGGLRAPGQHVHRRLRRRLQRARARRPSASRSARRRSAWLADGEPAPDGLHTERGVVRDVAYAGMVTRYIVDAGGGRRAAGRPAEPRHHVGGRARGARAARHHRVARRPDVAHRSAQLRRRSRDQPPMARSRSRSRPSCRSAWPRAAATTRAAAAAAARQRREGDRALRPEDAGHARQGRGRGRPHRLGRLRRGRLDGPEGRLGVGLREADRLPGQRQDRQHLRRDGHADAHGPVRRRVRVGRRDAAADRRRATSRRSTRT